MSIYTVYEPPPRSATALPDPARFVFVRDGFYWWAFLLTPFWMLRRRLWLVLVIYLIVTAALDVVLHGLGASAFLVTLTGALISLLIGLEASTLRRFTLRRRGWHGVGVVAGDRLEDAERRFFDVWTRDVPTRAALPPPAAPPPSSAAPEASGVIGLFPEPGAPR